MKHHDISRRSLLGGMSAAAVGTIGLASCSTGGPGASDPGAPAGPKAELPAYVPSEGIEPDLVSEQPGGLSGYFSYPADPQPAVAEAPLNGETISALTLAYDPVAPGLSDNPMWQAINQQLGGNLEITWSPAAEYDQKLATSIAGGSIPDFLTIRGNVQGLPSLLEAECADLTEFLSGEAVTDYPNLAAMATDSWQECMVGGKIWGVPICRVPLGSAPFLRQDMLDEAGLDQPKSFAEMKELLTVLTDESKSQWGASDPGLMVSFLAGSMGIASDWTENAGTFTMDIETEEYQQAIADVREMVAAGLFHPDSIGANNNQRNDWFTQGVTPMVFGGFSGWSKYETWGEDVPGFELTTLDHFSYDGSADHVAARGNVILSMTVLKKAEPDRIRLLLRVLDWLAAPFGSAEYLLTHYGIEGDTFDFEGTDPVINDRGLTMRGVPWGYVGSAPQTYYDPGMKAVTQDRFDYQEKTLPILSPDPTLGLYSATESNEAATLRTTLWDVRDDILAGRKDVSAWAPAVDEWRAGGGDKMRQEFEEAFAADQ